MDTLKKIFIVEGLISFKSADLIGSDYKMDLLGEFDSLEEAVQWIQKNNPNINDDGYSSSGWVLSEWNNNIKSHVWKSTHRIIEKFKLQDN